jgi:hypothetical protein
MTGQNKIADPRVKKTEVGDPIFSFLLSKHGRHSNFSEYPDPLTESALNSCPFGFRGQRSEKSRTIIHDFQSAILPDWRQLVKLRLIEAMYGRNNP